MYVLYVEYTGYILIYLYCNSYKNTAVVILLSFLLLALILPIKQMMQPNRFHHFRSQMVQRVGSISDIRYRWSLDSGLG